MRRRDRLQLFDDWAARYNPHGAAKGDFPFDGYDRVLDAVVSMTDPQPGMSVLDLGIGTANLAARLHPFGCHLWGIDFSTQMLAKAREKLPQATLVQADLLGQWPAQIRRPFDRIVSAYVLHEFDLPAKVTLLQRLVRHHLAHGGRIVIGDIAFPTVDIRRQARRRWADQWDDDEFYWAADETAQACKNSPLHLTYHQISRCAAVLRIQQRSQDMT